MGEPARPSAPDRDGTGGTRGSGGAWRHHRRGSRAHDGGMPARPDAVAALPAAPGVYRFRDAGGRVLYVGRAGELRRRVSSYWGDLRDRRHLRRMMLRVARIEALVCDSAHEAAWAERTFSNGRCHRGTGSSAAWRAPSASARTPRRRGRASA